MSLPTEEELRSLPAPTLLRNGFKVISQRDWRTLELLLQKLDPGHVIDATAIDHHETAWYREYFEQKP